MKRVTCVLFNGLWPRKDKQLFRLIVYGIINWIENLQQQQQIELGNHWKTKQEESFMCVKFATPKKNYFEVIWAGEKAMKNVFTIHWIIDNA